MELNCPDCGAVNIVVVPNKYDKTVGMKACVKCGEYFGYRGYPSYYFYRFKMVAAEIHPNDVALMHYKRPEKAVEEANPLSARLIKRLVCFMKGLDEQLLGDMHKEKAHCIHDVKHILERIINEETEK